MSAENPVNFRGIIPHLVCSPAADLIAFCKQAFDAEELMRLPAPDGERLMHACLKIDAQFVFIADEFEEYCDGASRSPKVLGSTTVTLHRNVDDCDAAFQRAVDAGAEVRMPPTDMFWGDRYAVVIDPCGHCWSFGTHLKDMSPEEINQAMVDAFQQGS
ncbi:Glyoxalase-like domain protein [Posidoniimonas polymericola]|uniref:Glyoxalase-like domain protein n=1 Tax=Posidoniimonas polymericola TaxID=2528002 RepID=A0A5C5YH95_9BACT|nr:VOC family protein [Posidoniimonas polymericola]TWT74443.1 Glyoxalase-like domain protein [Posidoniimonas polymericola]